MMVEPPAGRAPGAVARRAPEVVAPGAAGRELVASPRTWGRGAVAAGRVVAGRLDETGGRAVVADAPVVAGAAVVGGAVVAGAAVVAGGLVVVGSTG